MFVYACCTISIDPGDPSLTTQNQTDRTSTVQLELTDLTPDHIAATHGSDTNNDGSNSDTADKERIPPPPSFGQRFWDKSKLIITDTRTSMNLVCAHPL